MRPLVECVQTFCASFGAGNQVRGIDHLVEEPGAPCSGDIEKFRQGHRPLERGRV